MLGGTGACAYIKYALKPSEMEKKCNAMFNSTRYCICH